MRTGTEHSQITINKMSITKLGKNNSPSHCQAISAAKLGKTHKRTRWVGQYDYDCNLVAIYTSVTLAARYNNCSTALISLCCEGKCVTAKGYIFVYEDIKPKDPDEASKSNEISTEVKAEYSAIRNPHPTAVLVAA